MLSLVHRRAAKSYLFHYDTSVFDIVKIGLGWQNPKNFRMWESPSYFGTQDSFIRLKTVEQCLNTTFFRENSLPKTIEFFLRYFECSSRDRRI